MRKTVLWTNANLQKQLHEYTMTLKNLKLVVSLGLGGKVDVKKDNTVTTYYLKTDDIERAKKTIKNIEGQLDLIRNGLPPLEN